MTRLRRRRWRVPALFAALLVLALTAEVRAAGPGDARAPGDQLAPTFGNGGTLVVPAEEDFDNWAHFFQTAPLPDGGLVVAGYKKVLVLGPEGAPEPGFGRDGVKQLGPVDGLRLEVEDVAVDGQGRIVLFGGASTPADERETHGGRAPSQALVARLLPDGSFDPSFGGDGLVHGSFGIPRPAPPRKPFVSADFGAVDSLDRPLFTLPVRRRAEVCEAGFGPKENESRVVRLEADGALDPSFHGNSIAAPFAEGAVTEGFDLEPGGKAQVAAASAAGCSYPVPLLIQRRLPDGRPDPAFGKDGTRVYPESLKVRAVAPDVDGQTLILGRAPYTPGLGTKAAPVIRLTAGGDIDPAFGVDGAASVALPGRHSHIRTVLADSRGRVYVVGTEVGSHRSDEDRRPTAITVQRLTPQGRIDRGFGEDGLAKVVFPHRAAVAKAALVAGSMLVVVGTAQRLPFHSSPADLVLAGFSTE